MVWLWSVGPAQTIGTAGLEILASAQTEVYLSAASSWEVAIKTRLGKFQLPSSWLCHHSGLRRRHHFDPFDRLIIAQAMVEEMTVLTSNRDF